ncbi:MAG: amino acid permease [Candidatus Neomarinimicrobiota bacterium]
MISSRKFGTFEGVFTPTILTILGAIMYLRLGWVVGNAGFGGALIIILLAKLVTITTGLAIASMSSNIRIGAGGSYAIISRSLGLEIGGAIGIPLFLSQALSGAMYVIGFSEAWLAIFPSHIEIKIIIWVLLFLMLITLTSAKFAMKFQFIIMVLISASLVSFFMGNDIQMGNVSLWGEFDSAPFWTVFAIFFPAVTGIEAGAAMSGDLKNPSRSLSIGILGAITISFLVYVLLAFWMDLTISSNLLRNNYIIMLDVSRWRPIVAGAILGATFSSALGSLIGGPRTLMALAQHKVIPFGKILGYQSENGEPRLAIIFTGFIVAVGALFGNLNTIAPLLTMFFLITYGTINLAVFIEKRIGISSYRPTFKIPIIIPFIGFLWCTIAMFLINPMFAGSAIILIITVYVWLVREGHQAPWGDVRSGIFTALAEWAVRMAARLPSSPKSWKPNLMVPVEEPLAWRERIDFIRDIISLAEA